MLQLPDVDVRAYTGYIDIQARHLFFYFFESRSEPDKDDVLLWTNGGPGGSSSVGLLMELGPCRVLDADGPKFHPESWNTKANIFFIDQPVGTGFSYAEFGETAVSSTSCSTGATPDYFEAIGDNGRCSQGYRCIYGGIL